MQRGKGRGGDNRYLRRKTRGALTFNHQIIQHSYSIITSGQPIKLHLHIGTEKTGTTSAQKWFSQNRQALAESGVYYPSSLKMKKGSACHRLLSMLSMDPGMSDDAFWRLSIDSAEKHTALVDRITSDFADEFEQFKHLETWLISSEHLHSRVTNTTKIEAVQRFLSGYFSEIVVYIHLRPQIDLAVSRASTGARVGVEISRNQFMPPWISSDYYDYQGLVARWSKVFGAGNIVVIPYKRTPDFVRFLSGQLGLETDGYKPVDRVNEALGWRVIALTNVLQKNGNAKLLRRAVSTGVLGKVEQGEKLQVGLELADAVQARFEQGNDALIASRPELQPGDLSPERSNYDAPPNIDLLDQDCVFTQQLQQFVQSLVTSLMVERINTNLTAAERAFGRKKLENAQYFLDTALARLTDNMEYFDGLHSVNVIFKRIDRLENRFRRAARKAQNQKPKT